MDRITRGVMVTAGGALTTALTALALVWLDLRYDAAIYSFVYGFVLPFGAFFSGLVAASGYLLGARLFNYRPGWAQLAAILVLSGGTFFLVYWLEYSFVTVDGIPLRELESFGPYLAFALTHTALDVGPASERPVQLGLMGYGYAALQIAGFALGGLCIWLWLRASAYCKACSLYMMKQGSQTRYYERIDEMNLCRAAFEVEAGAGAFRRAVQRHAQSGSRQAGATTGYALNIAFLHCGQCGQQWLELTGRQRTNKVWSLMKGARYSAYCTERIDAMEKLAGS